MADYDHKALHFLHCQIAIRSDDPTIFPSIRLGIIKLLHDGHVLRRATSTPLFINQLLHVFIYAIFGIFRATESSKE